MADRFKNFAQLAAETRHGVDYRIRCADRGAAVAIIAPHGGTIEPGTAEIAEAVAGQDWSFYAFEALEKGAHGDFHITSHRFDEPEGVALVAGARKVIALHGRRENGSDSVWLGGRATGLRDAIGAALRKAGFEAEVNTRLPGVHETNICNRTASGEGVQLELSPGLRRRLLDEPALLNDFRAAIRGAVDESD